MLSREANSKQQKLFPFVKLAEKFTHVHACLFQVIAAVAFLIYALDMVMSYRRLKEARAERQREIAEGRATGNRRETHFCIIF